VVLSPRPVLVRWSCWPAWPDPGVLLILRALRGLR